MGLNPDVPVEGQASAPPQAYPTQQPQSQPAPGQPAPGYPPPPPHQYGPPPPHDAPPPPQYGAPPPPYGPPPPPYGAPPPPYGGPPPAYGYSAGGGYTAVYVSGPPISGQFSPGPIPGLRMEPPRVSPRPGQVILGYEIGEAEPGCCKCETLNPLGWIFVLLWVIVFPPLAFMVCLLPGMHEVVQRPVYGVPPPEGMGARPPHSAQAPTTVVIV